MEGPTPVFALIHAATMVTAGVFLIARSPLFGYAPTAPMIVTFVGGMMQLLKFHAASHKSHINLAFKLTTVICRVSTCIIVPCNCSLQIPI